MEPRIGCVQGHPCRVIVPWMSCDQKQACALSLLGGKKVPAFAPKDMRGQTLCWTYTPMCLLLIAKEKEREKEGKDCASQKAVCSLVATTAKGHI
eukprot:83316-Pelagomonas_calceolata.AAC.4